MKIKIKDCPLMAFSPTQSPVYGGDTLSIRLDPHQLCAVDSQYFVVFEGTHRRHVVSLRKSTDTDRELLAYIPGHDIAEEVSVTLVEVVEDEDKTGAFSYASLAHCYFNYEYDSTFYLTKFLTSSVYNDHALDSLELIKSDRFDLSHEVPSTLDIRLCRALQNANLSSSWHLLGGDSISDAHCEERETLLHFSARLGLQRVAAYLLEQPGSEDALQLTNRHGQLPHHVARANGYNYLADMLSGYNTDGMVSTDQDVEMDNAVFRNYANGTTSITSFLDSPTLDRGVENEIDFLRETNEMMRIQKGVIPQRHSGWPSTPNLIQNTGASRSLPTLPLEREMEETLDRILCNQDIYNHEIQAYLRSSSADSHCDNVRHPNGQQDQISDQGGGEIKDSLYKGTQQTQQNINNIADRPKDLMPREKSTGQQDGMVELESSLSGLRDLTDSLFHVRDTQLRQKSVYQKVRGHHLSRHSSSCPSLRASHRTEPLSPIDEGDHHKSMHDLLEEVGRLSPLVGQSPGAHSPISPSTDSIFFASAHRQSPRPEDQNIRICINGVTVDSSEDFPSKDTGQVTNRLSQDSGGSHLRKYNSLGDGRDEQTEIIPRRGSWCTDLSGVTSYDRRDHKTRVMMLAMTGKSLSLTSLDAGEFSEDDDVLEAARQANEAVEISIGAIGLPRPGTRVTVDDIDVDVRSVSPIDSDGYSPTGRDLPESGLLVQSGKMGGELAMSSHNAKSMSDLSRADSPKSFDDPACHSGSPGGPKSGSFEEGRSLSVPHSKMTKSVSTPSLPQATEASGESKVVRERRTGKHHDEEYQQYLLEEYDSQFRRQKEIEEEEEDDNAGSYNKKVEISWKDFISEEQSPNDSDEKSTKAGRKEEKRRKPSVFSRFQSSYRTKKSKEKESKDTKSSKDRHRFVAISFSNNTSCDACNKPMANKAALRCENCLVNVHQHNCKDSIQLCDKNRNKGLQRDGSAHGPHVQTQPVQGALLERQSASVSSGVTLRPSQSFKDKRSTSQPSQPNAQQLPTPPAQLSHRHSLPTSSLFGSPPNSSSQFFHWSMNSQDRFSVLDKAISEESEGDTISVNTMELGVSQTNMMDTNSESTESLDNVVPDEVSFLEDEPDLQLTVDEPEAWSITVDRKTLKKLSTKDIKRQDTIWELIQTEKQYVKRLKIMQNLFASKMMTDLNFEKAQVDGLFPKLDELADLHVNFLRQLLARQAKNEDRFIEEVGDILLDQFSYDTGDQMKGVYGLFCSKHTESMQLYKEYIKEDKKFQTFARRCGNYSVCEKRDISDFILGVTVRLAKYPILTEAILKSTKDKKDRESLSQALHMSRDVVQTVDQKVAAYEKLCDIQSKMDSRAVMYKNRKFKRQDLTAGKRELLHAGKIGWKSARGPVLEVLAVVLTDLIVILQKNQQKYSFLLADNKSCVIPLYRLLIREKRDAKESLGIYMISQTHSNPEMYELVCKTKGEREDWLRVLDEAIRACPADEDPTFVQPIPTGTVAEANAINNEEEKRKREEIKKIINQLHKKDEDIKDCCEEKNKLMLDLMAMSTATKDPNSRPNSQEIVSVNESVDIVQAAMQEASKLTTYIQTSGTALSRSVSSVGEHYSSSYVATPIPKRAETFSGFDYSLESPKLTARKQRYNASTGEEDETEKTASNVSLDDVDQSFTDMPEPVSTLPQECVNPMQVSTSSSPHALYSQSPLQHSSNAHLFEDQGSFDRSSDQGSGSLGQLSAASVSSLIPSPGNQEQMTSIVHLVQYLNALMNLTSNQNTKVESLRAELAEAKEEIAKLSADMHGRRPVYRHDQLEELRNLQETVSRDRHKFEKYKKQELEQFRIQREHIEQERCELEVRKSELFQQKEDLKRQKEVLQRQLDMMRGQGYQVNTLLTEPSTDELDLADGRNLSFQSKPVAVHRRSASADFCNSAPLGDQEQTSSGLQAGDTGSRGLTRNPRHSMGNLGSQATHPSSASVKQPGLPMHLLSARNEQRVPSGRNVQRLPLKLAGANSVPSPTNPSPGVQPSAAFFAGVQQPFPKRAGSSGISRHQSMSATSRAARSHHQKAQQQQNESSQSAPSSLSGLMKLADPKGGKSSPPSSTNPSHKPPLSPQSVGPPGAPMPDAKERKESGESAIIYF